MDPRRLAVIGLAVACVALAVSGVTLLRGTPPRVPASTVPSVPGEAGMLARIEKTGELHAGYGVYPPYTQEDPVTRRVSGFSVDLVEQICKELKCKVVWHRLNWTTMAADLRRGEFDVIGDPIYLTIPRAREFSFSEPYAYFPDGIAVVRKGDTRFTSFEGLDRPGIKIVVGQGRGSEALVRSRLTKPTIVSIQTATDTLQVFNEVLGGRADLTIVDGPDAIRFAKQHPDAVDVLWLSRPPAVIPAAFALRLGDTRSAEFLNASLRSLEANGVLETLARKYEIPSLVPRREWTSFGLPR